MFDRRALLKIIGIAGPAAAVGGGVAVAAAAPPQKQPQNLDFWAKLRLAQPPAGVTYEWKRTFIDSETSDPARVGHAMADGWRFVPASRHPEIANPGSNWIELHGLVLMERPTYRAA